MTSPSQRLLKLHRALGLVSAQAGRPAPALPAWGPVALDWAYGERPTLVQADVDLAIGRAAAASAVGIEALVRAPSPPAAAVLADTLRESLADIERRIGV